MYKNLLPIGSVVLLKGGEKRLMITSRIISKAGTNDIFDYAGCTYPEGMIDSKNMYFFNRDSIDTVFFIGFQDQEEINFRTNILDNLGELEIVDGAIVPKTE